MAESFLPPLIPRRTRTGIRQAPRGNDSDRLAEKTATHSVDKRSARILVADLDGTAEAVPFPSLFVKPVPSDLNWEGKL